MNNLLKIIVILAVISLLIYVIAKPKPISISNTNLITTYLNSSLSDLGYSDLENIAGVYSVSTGNVEITSESMDVKPSSVKLYFDVSCDKLNSNVSSQILQSAGITDSILDGNTVNSKIISDAGYELLVSCNSENNVMLWARGQ